MKNLVNTFGGAETHLEKTFETLEFPKIKKRILKHIKDNPEDSETRVAWDTYSKGARNTCRRKKVLCLVCRRSSNRQALR